MNWALNCCQYGIRCINGRLLSRHRKKFPIWEATLNGNVLVFQSKIRDCWFLFSFAVIWLFFFLCWSSSSYCFFVFFNNFTLSKKFLRNPAIYEHFSAFIFRLNAKLRINVLVWNYACLWRYFFFLEYSYNTGSLVNIAYKRKVVTVA